MAKAVLRGKVRAIQAYLKKQEREWVGSLVDCHVNSSTSPHSHPKMLFQPPIDTPAHAPHTL